MKLAGDIFVDNNIKFSDFTFKINLRDFEAVNEFYKENYPSGWFDKRMFNTGKYMCIRKGPVLCLSFGYIYF